MAKPYTPERKVGMINAAKYGEVETLKNGTKVRVRSIRADDKQRYIPSLPES